MSSRDEKPADDTTETAEITATADLDQPTDHPRALHAENLKGWRRVVTLLGVFTGLFLSLLDTTIVAVALPTIANQFSDFDRSTWVINAYLLTNMAFAIIISRFSDVFGRKVVECCAFGVFIASSLGCALSKTMTELIVFRALQGVGGSGLYSMGIVNAVSLVPRERAGLIAAAISTCAVLSGVLGPVLGGAITYHINSRTWPWIFWINLPIGGIAMAALLIAWSTDEFRRSTKIRTALKSIDFLGVLLLLAASVLLVFALQEAGVYRYAWNSANIICCLVFSGVCFFAFVIWQYWLTAHPTWSIKVVFPVSLMTNRVISSAIGSTFLAGYLFFVAVVNIPERFQIVSGLSPIASGVRLLPMLVSSATGSIIGGGISRKRNRTAYTLVAAAALQVLGYGLMTTLGDSRSIPSKTYGFQVFLGFGFGMTMSSATQMISMEVDPQWLAVSQGALAQMRTLGGSIGLAGAVIIFNHRVRTDRALAAATTPAQRTAVFRSPIVIETFSPAQQLLIARVFSSAFTEQMQVATCIAAACFVVSLGTLKRHPRQFEDMAPSFSASQDAG